MLFKILIGIIWLGILVLSPELCVFLTVGMLPAFVSYLVDVRPGKNTSATIAFFNLTGVIIPGMKFFNGTYSLNFARVLDFKILFVVYLFAGMGYFIVFLIPKITVIIVDYKNERRAIRIREKISLLVEDWGNEIKK